jgi:ubiquinone biosynthesis protein
VASIFFKQVFRDGFFHADLHPGNLFIDREGNVVMVDFGIMGRLDWNSRMYVAEIFRGFLTEDYKHVAEVHFRAGYVPKHKSVEQFTLACMAITKPILGKPANEISVGKMLGQLFKVTETFEMETQPQVLLLQKNMALIEGIGRMLNPNVNMWQVVEGPIKEWAASNMGPEARVKQLAQDSVEVIRKLPEMLAQTEQIIQKVNQGGLKLHPDTLSEIGKARRANQLRWLYFAWVALFILASAIIYHD